MKLIKCYVENFGKLQNFKFEFKSGLNTILEENGFGKTTFAVFIKSMFYGFDNSRAENTDRKRYKPWQSGTFGGNIEFEIDGKQYRIERTFGNKQADDTFKLYNLKTGLESNDYSENIGEEIFKINKTGYERSTYIPQGQIQIEMEDSLNAKLGNVLESENDIDSSDDAINAITDNIKIYKKTGNKGLLNEKKSELNELTRELENSKFDEITLDSYRKKLDEKNLILKEKSDLKVQKQELLSKKIEQGRKQAKQETYDKISKRLNENEEKYNKLKEFFKSGEPEDKEIEDLKEDCMKIERLKIEILNKEFLESDERKLEDLNAEFEGDLKDVTEEDIDEKIESCSKIQDIKNEIQNEKINRESLNQKIKQLETAKKDKNIKVIAVLVFDIILIVIGIFSKLIPVVTVGAICVLVAIILKFKGKSLDDEKEIKTELEEKNREIEVLEENKRMLEETINKLLGDELTEIGESEKIVKLMNLKADLSLYKDLANKKLISENNIKRASDEKDVLENKIKTYLNKYFESLSDTYFNLLQNLKSQKDEFEKLSNEQKEILKEKEEYEKENNIQELQKDTDLSDVDENELKKEIASLENEYKNLSDEKSQIKNNIEILENKVDENEYLETDIQNLKEEIENLEEKVDVLEKTKTLLENAKQSFSSHYLQNMIDGFKEYLSILDDKNLEASVDINLDVKLDVNGKQREVKNFSTRIQRFNIYLHEV